MRKETKEWLTGIAIGIILSLLLAVKVMAAPLSESDKELIAKTVQAEAGNQDMKGKRLVAAVIVNRVNSPEFPNTVEGVLSQDGQFSTYKYLNKTEATWQDRLAVRMESERTINCGVYFFRTSRYGTGEPLFKYGDHYFSGIKNDPQGCNLNGSGNYQLNNSCLYPNRQQKGCQ